MPKSLSAIPFWNGRKVCFGELRTNIFPAGPKKTTTLSFFAGSFGVFCGERQGFPMPIGKFGMMDFDFLMADIFDKIVSIVEDCLQFDVAGIYYARPQKA